MNYLQILWNVLLLLNFGDVTAQTNPVLKTKKNLPLYLLIKGAWYAEADPRVNLIFNSKSCIEKYEKDTTDNHNYILSYSCSIADSIARNTHSLNKDVYVVFYKDIVVTECSELLNLSNDFLSMRASKSEKLFVCKRKNTK